MSRLPLGDPGNGPERPVHPDLVNPDLVNPGTGSGLDRSGGLGTEPTTRLEDAARGGTPDAATAARLPRTVAARLFRYLEALEGIRDDDGAVVVASGDLAASAGVAAATLRKDLSHLGSHGVRGVGYDARRLEATLRAVLGCDEEHRVAIVGLGNLGRALAGHRGLRRRGLLPVALFDADERLVGAEIGGLVVSDISGLAPRCRELGVEIGVVAVPAPEAQGVCDALTSAGVRRILDFSGERLRVDEQTTVRSVDLAAELRLLTLECCGHGGRGDGRGSAAAREDEGTVIAR